MNQNFQGRTTVATTADRAAVGTVLLQAPHAAEIVAKHFSSTAAHTLRPGRIYFGKWRSAGEAAGQPGEEVVVARVADDEVEIHCHGGPLAARRIAQDLADSRCEVVDWRDWPAGDGAGRHPLAQEAWKALPHALTERCALVLVDQLNGALLGELTAIRDALQQGSSEAARERLHRLTSTISCGSHLTRPWRVAIVGQPNVGKSALMNAISGYERAIVYDEPGTTRDLVTVTTAIDGWPVEFVDTAGIRPEAQGLEKEGTRRSTVAADEADCLLLVSDLSRLWTEQEEALRARWPHALVVHNKSDLPPVKDGQRPAGLIVSALRGDGLEVLMDTIARKLVPATRGPGEAVIFTQRQAEALRRAATLVETDLADEARSALQAMISTDEEPDTE